MRLIDAGSDHAANDREGIVATLGKYFGIEHDVVGIDSLATSPGVFLSSETAQSNAQPPSPKWIECKSERFFVKIADVKRCTERLMRR